MKLVISNSTILNCDLYRFVIDKIPLGTGGTAYQINAYSVFNNVVTGIATYSSENSAKCFILALAEFMNKVPQGAVNYISVLTVAAKMEGAEQVCE